MASSEARRLLAALIAAGVELHAEGELLRYQAPAGALAPGLRAELSHRKGELSELIGPGRTTAPASAAQRGAWLRSQLDGYAAVRTLGFVLSGPLDADALVRALDALATRHEALRTAFMAPAGELTQVIEPRATVPLTTGPAALDPGRPPLLAAALRPLGQNRHELVLTVHELISDAWSLALAAQELGALYENADALTPAPAFRQHVQDERAWLAGPGADAALAHWRGRLADPPPSPWTPDGAGLAGTAALWIPPALVDDLRGRARRDGTTLFSVLLAAYSAAICEAGGVGEVIVGVPVANRWSATDEATLGRFANMLPLRVGTGADAVQAEVHAAWRHARFPFELLVAALDPPRRPGRNPLFGVSFGLQPEVSRFPVFGALRVERLPWTGAAPLPGLDLSLELWPSEDGLAGRLACDGVTVGAQALPALAAAIIGQASGLASWRPRPRRDPAAAIGADPAVERVVLDGDVAYAVTRARADSALTDRLQRRVGASRPSVVPVARLPLTADGEVDLPVLRAVPVLDADALATVRQAHPGVDAEVVPLRTQSRLRPAPASRQPAMPRRRSRLAVASGGPLPDPPDEPRTLPEVLARAAGQFPDHGVTFAAANGQRTGLSYPELLAAANQIAGGLRAAGTAPGAVVLLDLVEARDVVPAFWGCAMAGLVPAIVGGMTREAVESAWGQLGRPLIVGGSGTPLAGLAAAGPGGAAAVPTAGTTAIVTFTSGSSGSPRAIPLTHANLLARARAADMLCGNQPADVCLGWLPFTHIGAISDWHVRCVRLGCQVVHAEAEAVNAWPLGWLDLVSKYRITHSWAPNFAFARVAEALRDGARPGWDLSAVRALVTGGEVVLAGVVDEFIERCLGFGLRPAALRPAFGMAEVGSGITYACGTDAEPVRTHALGGGVLLTDLGPVLPGHEIRVVDARDRPLQEGDIGRLQIRGPAVFVGGAADDGWLRTGDMAFLAEGRLVVTGREDETIVANGTNIAPAAIEACVNAAAGSAIGWSAAFPVRCPDGGQGAAVVVGTRDGRDDRLLTATIRGAVGRSLGLGLDHVLTVASDEVERTAIGKVRRAELRRRVEAGELGADGLPDWFFERAWIRARPGPAQSRQEAPILVLGAGDGLADALAAQVPVLHGGSRLGEGSGPEEIVVLWGYGPTGARDGAAYAEALRALIAACSRRRQLARLTVVVTMAEPVRPSDPVVPGRATAAALLRSATAELPGMRFSVVDLEGRSAREDATLLLRELASGFAGPQVAYRDGERWIPVLRQAGQQGACPSLPRGGLVAVAGGLGGIGVAVTRWLLADIGARVLLLGRGEPGSRLRGLERLGAVRYVRADVADSGAVAAAVGGEDLAVIFQLAAVQRPGPLAEATPEDVAAVLRPKLAGTLALDEVARETGAAFVAFSSLAGVRGEAGAAAYAAASAFQNAYVHVQRAAGRNARCVAWSGWPGIGLGTREATLRGAGALPVTPAAGIASLRLALSDDRPLLLVGLDPDSPRLWSERDDGPVGIQAIAVHGPVSGARPADRRGNPLPVIEAPKGAEPRTLPATPTEQLVARLWRDLLEVSAVTREDSFFELGGHSLLAASLRSTVAAALGVELPVRTVFDAPTLAAFAAAVDTAVNAEKAVGLAPAACPLAPVSRAESLPLAPQQVGVWLECYLEPDSAAYTVPLSLQLDGELDVERLRRSLDTLLERHESLRTAHEPGPHQRVVQGLRAVLDVQAVDDEAVARRLAAAEALRVLDPSVPPLLHARLLRLGPRRHLLLLTLHHLAADGRGVAVLVRDLWALYAGQALAPLTLQPGDVAVWLDRRLAGRARALESWWRDQLAGAPATELPPDFRRPAIPRRRGAAAALTVGAVLTSRLRRLGAERDASLFIILLTAFAELIRRRTGMTDLVIGTDADGRDRPELTEIVGHLVSQVAIRVRVEGEPGFWALLELVRTEALAALDHAELPFDRIARAAGLSRRPGQPPPCGLKLTLLDEPPPAIRLPGLSVGAPHIEAGSAAADLLLVLARDERGGLAGAIRYDAELYRPETIEALARDYLELLGRIADGEPSAVASARTTGAAP
jgi:nonribosomal peptide synthetase DhbF